MKVGVLDKQTAAGGKEVKVFGIFFFFWRLEVQNFKLFSSPQIFSKLFFCEGKLERLCLLTRSTHHHSESSEQTRRRKFSFNFTFSPSLRFARTYFPSNQSEGGDERRRKKIAQSFHGKICNILGLLLLVSVVREQQQWRRAEKVFGKRITFG